METASLQSGPQHLERVGIVLHDEDARIAWLDILAVVVVEVDHGPQGVEQRTDRRIVERHRQQQFDEPVDGADGGQLGRCQVLHPRRMGRVKQVGHFSFHYFFPFVNNDHAVGNKLYFAVAICCFARITGISPSPTAAKADQ